MFAQLFQHCRCGFTTNQGREQEQRWFDISPFPPATCPDESVLPIRLQPDFCVVFEGYAGGDGWDHRTAWAGAGDGVLFIDVDNDGAISNSHEYIFTERAEGAKDDLDDLRRAFDWDGALTSTGARWGKVMATDDIQNWLQDRLDRRESA